MFLCLRFFLCLRSWRRPHVFEYFLIRNFFFPATAFIHTHPANSAAIPDFFLIRFPEWKNEIRNKSNNVWTEWHLDTIGYGGVDRWIRFEYATCGRRHYSGKKKKKEIQICVDGVLIKHFLFLHVAYIHIGLRMKRKHLAKIVPRPLLRRDKFFSQSLSKHCVDWENDRAKWKLTLFFEDAKKTGLPSVREIGVKELANPTFVQFKRSSRGK